MADDCVYLSFNLADKGAETNVQSRYEAVAATNDTCKHCGKNRPFHETNQMYCFDTEYRQVTKGENMEDQIKPGSSSGKGNVPINRSQDDSILGVVDI